MKSFQFLFYCSLFGALNASELQPLNDNKSGCSSPKLVGIEAFDSSRVHEVEQPSTLEQNLPSTLEDENTMGFHIRQALRGSFVEVVKDLNSDFEYYKKLIPMFIATRYSLKCQLGLRTRNKMPEGEKYALQEIFQDFFNYLKENRQEKLLDVLETLKDEIAKVDEQAIEVEHAYEAELEAQIVVEKAAVIKEAQSNPLISEEEELDYIAKVSMGERKGIIRQLIKAEHFRKFCDKLLEEQELSLINKLDKMFEYIFNELRSRLYSKCRLKNNLLYKKIERELAGLEVPRIISDFADYLKENNQEGKLDNFINELNSKFLRKSNSNK